MIDQPKVTISSYRNLDNVRTAAQLALEGKPIGVYNRGVCAIVGAGERKDFYESVMRIKGEAREGKPLALALPFEKFLPFIDLDKISLDLREIIANPEELRNRFGSLCFIRAPLTQEAVQVLPPYTISFVDGAPVGQTYDPYGHSPAEMLIDEMYKLGVKFPALTSMNISGSAEIVNQSEGIAFAQEHGIPIFLEDEKDMGHVQGSYTIFSVDNEGVQLMRDGHLPWRVFEGMWPVPIRVDKAKMSQYPQVSVDDKVFRDIKSSHDVRLALIYHLDNKE